MQKLFASLRKKIPTFGISGRTILIIFTIVIFVNSITLIVYTIYNKRSERLAYKEEMMTEIIDIIRLSHQYPVAEVKHMASLYKNNHISMAVTSKPLYQHQISMEKYWDLEVYLQNMQPVKNISIEIRPALWLNFLFHGVYQPVEIQSLIITLETIMGVMLLFFVWYIERYTKPLREFKKAAERLGIHLTPSPIIEYGPPIVKETAIAMNLMQKRIMSLIHDRTMMLAAISHDLRTPITRMKLQLSLLQEKKASLALSSDLDEMEQMIGQILIFTREANTKEKVVCLNLTALLMSLVDDKVEEGYQVDFISPPHKILYQARPLSLKRAFTNILNNGVKYAKQVMVFVEELPNNDIQIRIEDDGPGIPVSELAQVFKPFYRVDYARGRGTGGAGLGLAITQDIIKQHHGTIQLENRAEGGLRVIIFLPK